MTASVSLIARLFQIPELADSIIAFLSAGDLMCLAQTDRTSRQIIGCTLCSKSPCVVVQESVKVVIQAVVDRTNTNGRMVRAYEHIYINPVINLCTAIPPPSFLKVYNAPSLSSEIRIELYLNVLNCFLQPYIMRDAASIPPLIDDWLSDLHEGDEDDSDVDYDSD
jgi:hypothetical protein